MIVLQILLALIIFTGLGIGLYKLGIDTGIKFTTQFPEDEEPEVYRHEDKI